MKLRLLLVLVALAPLADAGVVKLATQPARHPWKDAKKVVKLATFPARHPMKTIW